MCSQTSLVLLWLHFPPPLAVSEFPWCACQVPHYQEINVIQEILLEPPICCFLCRYFDFVFFYYLFLCYIFYISGFISQDHVGNKSSCFIVSRAQREKLTRKLYSLGLSQKVRNLSVILAQNHKLEWDGKLFHWFQ